MSYRTVSKLGLALVVAAVGFTTASNAAAEDTNNSTELQIAPPPPPPPSDPPPTPPRNQLVQLENVRVVSIGDNPYSGIVPCVRVWKQTYIASKRGAPAGLRFKFAYKSSGKQAIKHAGLPLKNMTLLGDDASHPGFVRLETTFKVQNKPVDGGKVAKTKVKLKKKHKKHKRKKHKKHKRKK